MKENYIFYFDSGTSNTRLYAIDENLQVKNTNTRNIGSKDSALAGSNKSLIEAMKALYDEAIKSMNIKEDQVKEIFASGMITSPYGLIEIPHKSLPLTINEFVDGIYPFYEETLFKRTINLVPGLKTIHEDFSHVNNMRGEEIEIFGTLDELKEKSKTDNIAIMMPGSHTHITYVEGNKIVGILSNFTGELFYALRTSTILGPILDIKEMVLNKDMVKKGMENLENFGFNRAIYIAHAMRLFNTKTEIDRFSYAEGVVNGGIRKSLEYYCKNYWTNCDTVAIVSDKFMYDLYSTFFENSDYIKNIIWLPTTEGKIYAVEGLKKLISIRGDINE